MSTREKIIEVVNRLFVYTDQQNWAKLQSEVFTPEVYLDVSSMGGKAEDTTAEQICATWEAGFAGIDAINHLGGNYLVTLTQDEQGAEVQAYATATHYKKSAQQGQTRTYVGTYDLGLRQGPDGWRIHSFVYNLKYATGNTELK